MLLRRWSIRVESARERRRGPLRKSSIRRRSEGRTLLTRSRRRKERRSLSRALRQWSPWRRRSARRRRPLRSATSSRNVFQIEARERFFIAIAPLTLNNFAVGPHFSGAPLFAVARVVARASQITSALVLEREDAAFRFAFLGFDRIDETNFAVATLKLWHGHAFYSHKRNIVAHDRGH